MNLSYASQLVGDAAVTQRHRVIFQQSRRLQNRLGDCKEFILIVTLGLPAALLIRKREDNITTPYSAQAQHITPAPAWHDKQFRLFFGTILLASVGTFISFVHLVPAARDKRRFTASRDFADQFHRDR